MWNSCCLYIFYSQIHNFISFLCWNTLHKLIPFTNKHRNSDFNPKFNIIYKQVAEHWYQNGTLRCSVLYTKNWLLQYLHKVFAPFFINLHIVFSKPTHLNLQIWSLYGTITSAYIHYILHPQPLLYVCFLCFLKKKSTFD